MASFENTGYGPECDVWGWFFALIHPYQFSRSVTQQREHYTRLLELDECMLKAFRWPLYTFAIIYLPTTYTITQMPNNMFNVLFFSTLHDEVLATGLLLIFHIILTYT